MSELILIEPSTEYADDIWAFRKEILDFDKENELYRHGDIHKNSVKNCA